MANITKLTNKGHASSKRYQCWDTNIDENADDGTPIAAGDIFRIEDSLHRPANHLQIFMKANGSASFRINPELTVFPRRPNNEYNYGSDRYNMLPSGTIHTDTATGVIILEASENFTMDREIVITDIALVTFSGDFRLIVT